MDKKIKGTRIFLIIYGATLTFFSLYSLLLVGLMRKGPIHMTAEKTYIIFMPFLTLIGLSFLLFGILLIKIKTRRQLIFLLISIASLVWYFLYAISIRQGGMLPNTGQADIVSTILNIGFYILLIACSAIFIVPELLIWKKLNKIDKQNNSERLNNAI